MTPFSNLKQHQKLNFRILFICYDIEVKLRKIRLVHSSSTKYSYNYSHVAIDS